MAKKREQLGDRFFEIVENLFRELDQQSIRAEVEALQKKKPAASREEIANELISRAARKTAMVGATAGLPGGAFGLLAAAPDIFNLVRSQSRLVLSIAFLYDQKPGLDERFREVLAVLALSTGASATRQGVRFLIRKGLTGQTAESIMKKVAGRFMARKIPAIAPVVGSIAGAGLNYVAVQATGKIAIEYYSSELARSEESARIDRSTSKITQNDSRTEETPAPGKSVTGTSRKARTRPSPGSKKRASGRRTPSGGRAAADPSTTKRSGSTKTSSKRSKKRTAPRKRPGGEQS